MVESIPLTMDSDSISQAAARLTIQQSEDHSSTIKATAKESCTLQQRLYHRLDENKKEIRLLSVDLTDDSNLMTECKLIAVGLEAAEPYAALSYVWGDPNVTTAICVNEYQIKVTTNLANFLRRYGHFRSIWPDQKPLLLWVDAVSINQQDLAEKNSQVPLMGSIYKRSHLVYSRLGESFPGCEVAFDTLNILSNETMAWVESGSRGSATADWLNKYPKLCELDTSSTGFIQNAAWNSLKQLADHEYWSRTWIFQ